MATSTNGQPRPTAADGRSDAELVRACAGGDTGAPFTELVGRHGRTVLAVCRGLLGDGPDAEDAFQATFVVFLRRAGQVKQPAAVGGWLGGVAARVAGRLRRQRAKAWERGITVGTRIDTAACEPKTPASADPAAIALGAEERQAVWVGLAALPEKYRAVLLLCHLEERTTEQAAGALGCPVGTVRSRLLKARELLRVQLLHRGIASAAALLVLAECRAEADPPPELLHRTVTSAGGSTPAVERLVRAWEREEFYGRLRFGLLAAALLALLLALLVGVWLARPKAETPISPEPVSRASVAAAVQGTLLVVCQRDSFVLFLDPSTGHTRSMVAVGASPHEVAVSPDGRTAAVANYGLPFGTAPGGTVTLLDVAAGIKLKTIDVGPGSAPHGLFWLDNRRFLCTTEAAGAVVEIDAAEGAVVRTLRTGQAGTHMIAANGQSAYTANFLSETISVLDLGTGRKLRDIVVGKGPEGIAVSPDGKRVWVGNRADDTISVVSTVDFSVVKVIRAPGSPLRAAFTPDGTTVVVSLIESGELALFDAVSMTERKRVKLSGEAFTFDSPGPTPGASSFAFSPDGRTAYCSMFFSKAIAVVDLASGSVAGKFVLEGDALDGIAFTPVVSAR